MLDEQLLVDSQTWTPFLTGNTLISASCHDIPSQTLRTISKTENKKY